MRSKRKLAVPGLVLAAWWGAFAQGAIAGGDYAGGDYAGGASVSRLLPIEAAAQLAASGKAVRSSSGDPGFLPAHPASAGIREALAAEKPSVLVEAVFALPRAEPAGAAARSAELSTIYGILRSLGSLQGIEYYSASHKAMRTLYAESYIVDGPSSTTRLADPPPPAPGALPPAETLFAFQRDLSFGANSYRYDYAAYPDAVLLKSGNLTRMSYGILPLIAPNGLATRLLVIQAEDAILFYVESGAKAPDMFKGRLEESFANRAEALFKWFQAKSAGLGARR
jgi:hypothetical protein